MHRYFIKTPWWVKKIFSQYTWSIRTSQQEVFLTFDDGPHPTITPWVLEQLAAYNAKATFFCIGQNVLRYNNIYKEVLAQGHAVGNHTHTHLNGWTTVTETYLKDVAAAATVIHTNLFRPPYGRIKNRQASRIAAAMESDNAKVIMWDVLSADFDNSITSEQCTANVLRNVERGSIVVFHDSEKAFANLQGVLPVVLQQLHQKGFAFNKLETKRL